MDNGELDSCFYAAQQIVSQAVTDLVLFNNSNSPAKHEKVRTISNFKNPILQHPVIPKKPAMVPSLEIRINSVEDAKALIANLGEVHKEIKRSRADSVELKIAEECIKEVNKIVYGIFRVKVYTSVVKCADGRVLYAPTHFCEECATRTSKAA